MLPLLTSSPQGLKQVFSMHVPLSYPQIPSSQTNVALPEYPLAILSAVWLEPWPIDEKLALQLVNQVLVVVEQLLQSSLALA